MGHTQIAIRTLAGATAAAGWAGGRAIVIDRPASAGGLGIGFNGGELLLLAVGACCCNDLYREAQKRELEILSVQIEVEADWGGEPLRAQNLHYTVRVTSSAPRERVEELIRHTDQVAEIPNSLRLGTEVRLRSCEVASPA